MNSKNKPAKTTQAAGGAVLATAVRRVLAKPMMYPLALAASALVCPASAAPPLSQPAIVELSALLVANGGDGSNGLAINAIAAGDKLGISVSAAGDINGDGIADAVFGSYGAGPNGQRSGQCYLVFGRPQGFGAEFNLSTLLASNGGDGSAGVVFNGIAAFDRAGHTVAAAGDVNGDGIDDLAVGAFGAAPNGSASGQSYVVFGRQTGFPAEFEFSALVHGDGSEGFALNGIAIGNGAGLRITGAGDINGDGTDDLVVGAAGSSTIGSALGESYVVFGNANGFPAQFELSTLLPGNGGDGSAGFVVHGIAAFDDAGRRVSPAGDFNHDGIDDLLVSAERADPTGEDLGQVYVVFGSNQGFAAQFDLASLGAARGGDGSRGLVLNGIRDFDGAGSGIAAPGDVNGDGIDDIIVGASAAGSLYNQPAPGEAYVVFGRDSGFDAELELSGLLAANGGDGSVGVVLQGIELLDSAGASVGSAGDVNGDGIADVIVGATSADPNGSRSGQAYIVFGRHDGFPAELPLAGLGSADGITINGIAAGDVAAFSVNGTGDIDGDGIDDVALGAHYSDHSGSLSGQAYVVFGKAATLDTDNDGLADDNDNCSAVANPAQRDTDSDGYGNFCDPDFNQDLVVNFVDLGVMKGVFFGNDPDADLNGDGAVNFLDLNIMKQMFFQLPGPSGFQPQ